MTFSDGIRRLCLTLADSVSDLKRNYFKALPLILGGHNKNSCSGGQKYKAFEDSHEGVWFCITAVLNNKMMVKKVSKHGYRIPNETAVVIIKATIQHLLINISQVSILYCTLSVSEHSTKFFGSKWSE